VSTKKTVIILVEDDPQIRRFVSMALEAENCEVHEADTVKRGLIETGTRKPDIAMVLSSFVMCVRGLNYLF